MPQETDPTDFYQVALRELTEAKNAGLWTLQCLQLAFGDPKNWEEIAIRNASQAAHHAHLYLAIRDACYSTSHSKSFPI